MATPQELQNALMLTKSGLTTEQAVNQARVPFTATSQINQDRLAQNQASRQGTTTPIAPINSAPISPTTSVNQAQREANIASRQANPLVPTPTPIAQAPVNPNTGLSTPLAPSVQPTTQQPVQSATPDPTPGITQDSFNQAKLESEKIKAQNDAVMAQNKQKSDLAREDATIAAQAAIPTDQKGIVNAIISGVPVAPQKTQAYNNALVVANQFKKFNGMSSDQLFQNLQQGQIGTELSGLLSQNPNFAIAKQKYEQAQKTKAINAQANAMYNAANGKENPVVDELAKIESKYSAPLGTNAQAYEQFVVQDPDVIKSALELKTLATQINDVTKTYNDALKSLKTQYPDMPASALITLMGTRTKDTKELLDSYVSAKELAKGDFDLAMKMAEGHYGAVSKDIAEQDQIEKEQRALQAQKDALQYEADFNKKQAELALSDPATAIKSVMDEYKKLGIPFTSTVQSRLAEFKASGKPLEQFLTEMGQNIQQSPAYQKYQALQQGQMSDAQKVAASQNFDIKKMGLEQDFQMKLAKAKETTNNKWTKLDDGMYTNESGDIITAEELKTAKLTNNSYITKPVGAEGGDCGFYASRGTGMTATPGGNSKEARTKAFSETMPQVGGMAFFGGAGYDPTYGHISIVTGVNQDGTINVKESNYSNNGKVTERTVPASSVTGYYNNTPLAKGLSGGTTTQPPSSEANSWVNAWNNGTMDIETILTKIGNTKEALPLKNEVIKAIDAQGGVAWRKENDPMVTKVDDLINKLDTSSKSSYLNTVAGTVQTSLSNFLTGGKNDLLADLKSVIEGGTLQALINAKAQGATFGALSNEELKMLQATSSALAGNAIRDPDTKEIVGFKMSETKLKSEIDKMKNLLVEKKNRMTGVGIKQETPKQSNTAPAYTAPTSNDPFGIR